MVLGKKLLRSPSYKHYVEKWQHGESILEHDRTFVRDFLMMILLVTGGGHRGDVIRNMTVEEFHNMTFRKREDGTEVTYLKNIYNIKYNLGLLIAEITEILCSTPSKLSFTRSPLWVFSIIKHRVCMDKPFWSSQTSESDTH